MEKIKTRDIIEVKYLTGIGYTLRRKYITNDNGLPYIEYEMFGIGLKGVYESYLRNKRQIDLLVINNEIRKFYEENYVFEKAKLYK